MSAQARSARDDVEALPAAVSGMAAQSEQSVVARAQSVLAGLADRTASGETAGRPHTQGRVRRNGRRVEAADGRRLMAFKARAMA